MNKKHKQLLGVFFLNFLIICIFLSVNVSAQGGYQFQLNEDDEYVWEIKELNHDKFEFTFNAEPNFDIGDRKKITIRDITDNPELGRWTVTVAFWDFGNDWTVDGEIQYLMIKQNPEDYNDPLFVPAPVDDYLEAAKESDPSTYYIQGPLTIGKQARDLETNVEYRIEKTFEISGIIFSETIFDKEDIVIVKMERIGFIIPYGFTFVGFMALAIISLIAVFINKNKIRFT